LRLEASEFVQAQSDLLNAAAALKLARINEERKHSAYESKGGSLQDWQQSQVDLTAAENADTSAKNRLRILGKSDAEIAAIESSKKTEAATDVVAPIAGVVTDRQVGPGQYIQAGASNPVFSIGDLSTVWLVADVPETQAPYIERGQAVQVKVLALPGRVFDANLTAIGAQVDPVTRRVPVRATLANPDGKLKPQMFASFSIITSGESQSPSVPEEAVVREGDQARVWVIGQNNTLALRSIRTGRSSQGMVEVLDGLKAGERIVTRGSLFIDRAARSSSASSWRSCCHWCSLAASHCSRSSTSKPIPTRFRRSWTSSRRARGSQRRRSSATSLFPSKSRWRAFRTSVRCAPFRCSVFRT
jgi:cobalt-zinc-cadmium efflux system membrane fusion protein